MQNKLHDEIDAIEDLRDRATAIGQGVKDKMVAAMQAMADDGNFDIRAALVLLAAGVEEELASLTTEAFDAGVGFSKARRE